MDLSKRGKNDLNHTTPAHCAKLLPCAVVENSDRRAISQVRRQRFPKMQKRLRSAASCQLRSTVSYIQPPAKKNLWFTVNFHNFRKCMKEGGRQTKFFRKIFTDFKKRKEEVILKTDVARVAQAIREKMVILFRKIYLRLH